jgi:hypothetical protein
MFIGSLHIRIGLAYRQGPAAGFAHMARRADRLIAERHNDERSEASGENQTEESEAP